jgi:carbamoyl-phosphate synthase small subunit
MNCIISSEILDIEKLKAKLKEVPRMEGLELSSKVSCTEPYNIGEETSETRVAVLDLGAKKNIVRCFAERGAFCRIFPMNTPIEEMEKWEPNGYMISNGPGDPAAMLDTTGLISNIIEVGKPVFGICLGHQVIALSQGLKTVKMFNGHRGINHPVLNKITGRGEITSQNHGFVVEKQSAENSDIFEVTHYHINDGTVAGLRLKNKPVFSVQYHPESSPGPNDSRYLFDQFIDNMKVASGKKNELNPTST